MTVLRVGTRGSELALRQTRWVCERLRAVDATVHIEEVVITTAGDASPQQPFNEDWPMGGFTSAIEEAILAGRVDFAVHSCKDLPTTETAGLEIVAIPEREAAHDVLVSREAVDLARVPKGTRIGTGSPRRAAQCRCFLGDVEIIPIRGNVPTRIGKVESGELDAVVLATAGIRRLGLKLRHCVELPVDKFVPAPGQGALAVQARGDSDVGRLLARIDDAISRGAVTAERAFLSAVGAGCQTAAGALARVLGGTVALNAQLFSEDGRRFVSGAQSGSEPCEVGAELARRLREELARQG